MDVYERLRDRWRRIAAAVGARIDEVALDADPLVVIDIGDIHAPTILLSAGIHGDEPAAVAALAALVQGGSLDRRYAYRIFPCINPSGFRSGRRLNASGADVNRSFDDSGSTTEARACVAAVAKRRYVLSIDLHEDHEATGFYAYDSRRRSQPTLGGPIVAALDAAGLPVQELTSDFDLGYAGPLDDRVQIERGRVISSFEQQTTAFAGWPFTTYLLAEHTERALILESPQRRGFATRVRMHRLAVEAGIAQLDC